MANIIDYVRWRGDIPVEQVPLCEVDALILSYLSYMPFDGIVGDAPEGGGIPLAQAAMALLLANEQDGIDLAYSVRDDRMLLPAVAASERFGGMRLVGYVNRYDRSREEQFSAVTFLAGDTAVIAYRGTDGTVVGWKEDFNMSFEEAVPAQSDAVDYAQRVVAALGLPVMLCGHSKGGNLAVYAATFSDDATRGRVQIVYNFDGPGFNEKVIASPEFARAGAMVRTFVPQSSMVGIMFWHDGPFTIVKSDSVSIFQHNAYTWQVMGGHFVTVEERTSDSYFADDTVKRWMASLTPEKRKRAIDGIYAVLDVAKGRHVSNLFEVSNLLAMLRAAGAMDDQTREAVEEFFRLLGTSAAGAVPDFLDRTADGLRQRVIRREAQRALGGAEDEKK